VAGARSAVLDYRSAYYPGYGVSAKVFPLGLTGGDADWFGAMVDFGHGFDSVNVAVDTEGGPRSLSHLQVEGGLLFRLDRVLDGGEGGQFQMRLKLSARHIRYTVEENPSLPSTTLTAPLLGLALAAPVGTPRLMVRGWVEASPYLLPGRNAELFGASQRGFEVGGGLDVIVDIAGGFGAALGYGVQMYRTNYRGEGLSDFVDATGFELVHALDVGLVYRN
jgi:hypothetical protein